MSLQKFPQNENLNNVSKTVLDYLEKIKLKPGQLVKYRLLNGTKNIDPERAKGDDMLYPSCIAIQLQEKIKDPEGGVVQIGVVSGFDDNGMPLFASHIHTPQKGDGGFIFLSGDRVADIEMYDVLELKNENKSNPFRDTSVNALFERVDEAKESKVRSSKRNFLFDCLDAIRHWTPDEMRIIAASYNMSPTLDPEVLKDRLEEIAEKDPKTFYDAIDQEDTKIKAVIKLAKDASIIHFNAHENKWVYAGSNETVALLDRREGVDEITQLKEFLKTSANGQKIQGQLEKLLKAKK